MAGPPKVPGKDLADACGIKPPSVSDWLSGKTKSMDGHNLLAASEFLRVRPKWLAEGVGPMRIDDTEQNFCYDPALSNASLIASESLPVSYLPERKTDPLTAELMYLFSQLDDVSKREYLAHLRGFVAGRHPHPNGGAPAVAG